MQLNVRKPELALDTGQILTLDNAEGLRILARKGAVWVTEEGDVKDHIVHPGDTLIVAHPGRTVVQALQPSWISIGEGAIAANDAN
jgi:uncharacterized protein with PhoU and TrkA domain